MSQMPLPVILEDPQLLKDTAMQSTFIDTMNRNSVGQRCADLSKWASALQQGLPIGFGKEHELNRARLQGKRCCGVHAVLVSITPEALPKNPAHLLEHAIAIEAKLQKKGIGNSPGMVTLPLHFQKVLCALKKAGEEAKQKATEQKVKDNQDSPDNPDNPDAT